MTSGGETDRFVAAGAASASALVARAVLVTLVPGSSGCGSGGHPAGFPTATGGWKSNGAAPMTGR